MKQIKFMLFALVAMLTTTLSGCSNNDDDLLSAKDLPPTVQKAFNNKYPDATVEGWRMKDSYCVVDFTMPKTKAQGGIKASAWFDNSSWKMTERDDVFEDLPKTVRASFEASFYAEWHIDDIDVVERFGMETMFVIEVKNGKTKINLFFFADGTLFKKITDPDYEDYLPEIPSKIIESLVRMFPGYVVLDAEFEDGNFEIEIRMGNRIYEIEFDCNFKWIHSKWEVSEEELPDPVLIFIAKNHPGYKIDDIHKFKTVFHGTYYIIELEKGKHEVKIIINEQGKLVTLK